MADTNSVKQATDVASVNSDSSDGSPAQNGTVDTQVFVRSHSIVNLDHIIDDLLNGKWFDKITRSFTILYSDPSLFASMMLLVTGLFVSVFDRAHVFYTKYENCYPNYWWECCVFVFSSDSWNKVTITLDHSFSPWVLPCTGLQILLVMRGKSLTLLSRRSHSPKKWLFFPHERLSWYEWLNWQWLSDSEISVPKSRLFATEAGDLPVPVKSALGTCVICDNVNLEWIMMWWIIIRLVSHIGEAVTIMWIYWRRIQEKTLSLGL